MLNVFLILMLFSHFYLKDGIDFMNQWMRSMQLMIHLPLMNILVPANISSFLEDLMPFVMFDIIPPEYSTEVMFTYDDQADKRKYLPSTLDQVEDLGYDSSNSMLLLGSVSIFLFIYVLLVILYYVFFKPASYCWPTFKKLKKSLKIILFYSFLHAITMEPIIEWMISGYVNIKYGHTTTLGEVIGRLYGWISLWLVGIFIPLSLIYFISRSFDTLTPSEKTKWRYLFDGVKTQSRMQYGF